MTPRLPNWHTQTLEEISAYWRTNPTHGLTSAEANVRRERLGPNSLPEPPKPDPLRQFLLQFANPIVLTLLVAAGIATAVEIAQGGSEHLSVGRFADTIAILLIVILNALLGFYQERKAEAALDALQKMAAPTAKVVRGGSVVMLPAAALVPGDIVELESGDHVPADVRLFQTHELSAEEAALTGESVPVLKDARITLAASTPLADRRNLVYLGTSIVRGRSRGVVVQTGAHTELGRIGALIGGEKAPTPLEDRLSRFGRLTLYACLAVSALVFLMGLVRGHQPVGVLLLTAVSLAVAAIPEGLPAITTITLALGMQRMARRGAIVRKLPAVETLGCATVICSDKTGTLTAGEMTVRAIHASGLDYEVTGEGYRTGGEFLFDGKPVRAADEPGLEAVLRAGVLCNSAHLEPQGGGAMRVVGDPTEGALLVVGLKAELHREELLRHSSLTREIPFDSDRRRMSVVLRSPEGKVDAFVKGSVDVILERSVRLREGHTGRKIEPSDRERITRLAEQMAARGLRVLALAERSDPDDDPERGLELLGLVGIMDPPRAEVREAIAICRSAGIRAVMITGDHQLTAEAIAKELEMWEPGDLVLTGVDIDGMEDQRLAEMVDHVRIFARVTAEHKLRIVRAFRARGHVAAMTGDGVNDAPAIREASIGIAMGRGGTDVARGAADMVLADDNFATIVTAVREGRAIFSNIQKAIWFLLSSNAGLVLTVFASSFFDWLTPLTPLQILWINLVTNGLPALALGVDPPDPTDMAQKPRPLGAGILGARDYLGLIVIGLLMAAAAVAGAWAHRHDASEARTIVFCVLSFAPLVHTFNCRSNVLSIFRVGWFTNLWVWGAILISGGMQLLTVFVAPLRPIFHTSRMDAHVWPMILATSLSPLIAVELYKAARAAIKRAVAPAGTVRSEAPPSSPSPQT